MSLLIEHCRLISPGVDLENASILVRNEHIVSADHQSADADTTIDGSGLIAMPGFFDIHTHGADGFDLCDPSATAETVEAIARAKLREGVTSYFPTSLSVARNFLKDRMTAAAEFGSRDRTPTRFHGVHVEGPFINPKCAGAQNPEFIRLPDLEEIDELSQVVTISKVSVAPEIPGAIRFIEAMRERNIVVSLAHTAATYAEFKEAKAAGATHLTHFCNQMTPLHHREIGLVGAGLLDDEIMLEMICDGVHLSPDMIRLVFKCVPISRIMLITDSMAASGLGDGTFVLGGQNVLVRNREARLEGGALAGSTLQFNHGLKLVHEVTGLPLKDLVTTTAWNQAHSMNIPDVGKLEPGFLADIVLLDADLNVVRTIVGGKVSAGDATS